MSYRSPAPLDEPLPPMSDEPPTGPTTKPRESPDLFADLMKLKAANLRMRTAARLAASAGKTPTFTRGDARLWNLDGMLQVELVNGVCYRAMKPLAVDEPARATWATTQGATAVSHGCVEEIAGLVTAWRAWGP